jgi:hypothetical protein
MRKHLSILSKQYAFLLAENTKMRKRSGILSKHFGKMRKRSGILFIEIDFICCFDEVTVVVECVRTIVRNAPSTLPTMVG